MAGSAADAGMPDLAAGDDVIAGDVAEVPPPELVCPITGCVFRDPVTLPSGHTYERAAIVEWFARGGTTCPLTRQAVDPAQLAPNPRAKMAASVYWPRASPGLSKLESSLEEQAPEVRREPAESGGLSIACARLSPARVAPLLAHVDAPAGARSLVTGDIPISAARAPASRC